MAYREIDVQERSLQGSTAVSRLRREGQIPGVVYGGGDEAQSIMFDGHSFMLMARKSPPTQLFKFKSEKASLDGMLTLVKSVQTEPVKDTVLHVDFLAVHEGQRMILSVPLEIVGESPAVKEGRAVLNQTAYEIELECLPKSIPEKIEVDVNSLNESQSIHAHELVLPEGVVLKSSSSLNIVSTVGSKLMVEETTTVEGEAVPAEEAVEGEEPKEPKEPTEDPEAKKE